MTKELMKDIIQWDVKTWSKALNFWEKEVDWSQVQNGLELGGRQGGLSLWLALKGKEVVCSDLSDVKNTAELLHKKHHVVAHVSYEDIDTTQIPYENHFDIIVFKSIIGGIGRNDDLENQRKVFAQIHKALKPGGKLLFAENLVASRFHQKLRKQYITWADAWRYITMTEMEGFLSDFSKFQMETTGVLGTFGRNETQRNFLAAIDKLLLNHICPTSWKYVVYGVAEK